MDEICMMFAPNMWRSVHTKHAMPYVYQIFVSNMCPVPMRMVILPGLKYNPFSKKAYNCTST